MKAIDTTLPNPFDHPATMKLAREVVNLPDLTQMPTYDAWIKAKLQHAIDTRNAHVFIPLMCNIVADFLPDELLARFRQLPLASLVTHKGLGLQMKLKAFDAAIDQAGKLHEALKDAKAAGDLSLLERKDEIDAFLDDMAAQVFPDFLKQFPKN